MTDNLQYELVDGQESIRSYNDGSTSTYTPTSCNASGTSGSNCAMNGHTSKHYITDNASGHTGIYYTYSWFAATAGAGTSSSAGDVDGSICPSGWKLPYRYAGSGNKSYGSLLVAYNISASNHNTSTEHATISASPLSFNMVGTSGGASGAYANDNGIYWTSAARDSGSAYRFIYSTGNVNAADSYGAKSNGVAVRCVAI